MKRSIIGLIVGVLVVLVVAGGLVWWKLSSLKGILVRDLGNALGAQVEVSTLTLDPWKRELHAAGISLTNLQPSAPWEKGEIGQATVRFHLHDLFSSSIPLSLEVDAWSVVLRPATTATPETTAGAPPPIAPAESTAPPSKSRVHVTEISAHNGTVEMDFSPDKIVVLHDVAFESNDNGAGVWTTGLRTSSLVEGALVTGPGSVQIRGDQEQVAFSSLHLQCDQGYLTGDGSMALSAPHEAQFTLKATKIPVTMLVATAWQLKLSGLVTGDLHYEGNDQNGGAKGQLAMDQGKFSLLPWLGEVTGLVGLPDVSNVEVDKMTSDYTWNNGTLQLTNLDVRKNDVIRIAGTVDVSPQGLIDGKLKLGLPTAVLSKWPDLQKQVFPVDLEDYSWTDVRLTGTPDHLQEDLTPRLVAFGVGQGTDLLNQGTKKAMDLLNNILGK